MPIGFSIVASYSEARTGAAEPERRALSRGSRVEGTNAPTIARLVRVTRTTLRSMAAIVSFGADACEVRHNG